MKFKNFNLATKLGISFGILAVILAAVGLWEFALIAGIEQKEQDVIKSYDLADAVMETKNLIVKEEQILMEMMDATTEEELSEWLKNQENAHNDLTQVLKEGSIIVSDKTWGEEFNSSKQNVLAAMSEISDKFENELSQQTRDFAKIKADYLETSSLAERSRIEEKMDAIDKQYDSISNSIVNTLKSLEDSTSKFVETSTTESHLLAQRSKVQSTSLLILGVLISVVFAVWIIRAIRRPLKESVEFSKAIAKGDLTVKLNIDQKDEVGELAASLSSMLNKLSEIVSNIRTGTDNIASASEQISSGSQQLSQGASEQASSTEEVSSSMEEMSSNIQQNMDNARQTESISMKAADSMMAMSKIANESFDSIKTIAEKITIINDIAFQTNLLALNAAVEAARAGEHGRGFAVVASEVRKLAERSKHAADEIETLSKNSLRITEKTREMLDALVPEIQKTAQLVQEIAAASIEQSSGTDQINSAIQQLNVITQQNAASSEEMATSAEELSTQADSLKDIVAFFNTGNNYHHNRVSAKESDIRKFINNRKEAVRKAYKAHEIEASEKDFEKFV